MLDQLNRVSPLVRASALIAALLIAIQIVVVAPAAATPASEDDEVVVMPVHDEDEAVAEPTDEEDAVTAEPTHEEDEAVAEPAAEDDTAAAEPIRDEDEMAVEPVHEENVAAAAPAPEVDEVAAAPAHVDDAVADLFLQRLLDAINKRRDYAGTQRLGFIPASANAALDGFLAKTLPVIRWPGPCGHHLVDGAFSWDYVQAAGFGGDPRGEVLACPGPEPYWTPDRAAEQWWDSPIHHDVLYADPDANALACSAYGVHGGGKKKGKNSGSPEAASAVLCVTFRG